MPRFDRITCRAELMNGQPTIRGMFRRQNTGHRQVVREMLLSLLRIEQRR